MGILPDSIHRVEDCGEKKLKIVVRPLTDDTYILYPYFVMGKELRNNGMRSMMLKVEGPFHTPITKLPADKFKKALEAYEIDIASRPVIRRFAWPRAFLLPTGGLGG